MIDTLSLDDAPIQVLIVEDDPLMQLGLEQFFDKHEQFTIVDSVEDGFSAVEQATQRSPHLIIMDIGLPRMDGIEATRQIKQSSTAIGIIMLTSHNSETEALAAFSSGADAYCIKGTRLEQLLVAIMAVQEGAVYLDPQIARCVMNNLKPAAPQTLNIKLSDRELEVLKLLVDGKTNPEIGELLFLSPSTIKVHIRNIMTKLSVDDRVQAAVVALRSGLV